MNPYRLPNDPALTIREVMVWIWRQKRPVTLHDVMDYFDIQASNAGTRLMKLHRWGYLRRRKPPLPPKIYQYEPTRFGARQARKWK